MQPAPPKPSLKINVCSAAHTAFRCHPSRILTTQVAPNTVQTRPPTSSKSVKKHRAPAQFFNIGHEANLSHLSITPKSNPTKHKFEGRKKKVHSLVINNSRQNPTLSAKATFIPALDSPTLLKQLPSATDAQHTQQPAGYFAHHCTTHLLSHRTTQHLLGN